MNIFGKNLEINKFDVRIDCWMRAGLDESLKIEIIQDIITWLRDYWPMSWAFACRSILPAYIAMYE